MLQLNNEYNYTFRTYRSRQSLEDLTADWHALVARAGDGQTPFQTPEWCMTWLSLNPDAQPCFIGIHENDQLIFLAALMQVKSLPGVRSLCFLSDPDCSYGNIICDQEKDPALLFEDCVNYLKDEGICDLLQLANIAREAPWAAGLDKHLGISALQYSSLLVIDDDYRQDYFSALHKTIRRDVRHSRRQLEQLGKLSVAVVDCDQHWREEVLPQLIEWKKAWLNNSGRWGGEVFDSGFEDFLFKLTENCQSHSFSARSCVVKLDGRVISANLVFLQDKTVFGYFSSFDPGISKVSLGTLRDVHLIEWMLDNRFEIFDLLGYPETYKARIANRKLQLANLRLALNAKGSIAIFASTLNPRKFAKRIFYHIPPGWRRSIIGLLRR